MKKKKIIVSVALLLTLTCVALCVWKWNKSKFELGYFHRYSGDMYLLESDTSNSDEGILYTSGEGEQQSEIGRWTYDGVYVCFYMHGSTQVYHKYMVVNEDLVEVENVYGNPIYKCIDFHVEDKKYFDGFIKMEDNNYYEPQKEVWNFYKDGTCTLEGSDEKYNYFYKDGYIFMDYAMKDDAYACYFIVAKNDVYIFWNTLFHIDEKQKDETVKYPAHCKIQ